jgi:hypothetical protein
MRHGAMTTNTTQDVAPIRLQKKILRALTAGRPSAGEEAPDGEGSQAAGPTWSIHAGYGGFESVRRAWGHMSTSRAGGGVSAWLRTRQQAAPQPAEPVEGLDAAECAVRELNPQPADLGPLLSTIGWAA